MPDITVACVLRSGSFYNADWVARLQRGVRRHLPLPHHFVCLTDMPGVQEAEVVPLVEGWQGWWAKIELFRKNIFSGPVLYLDLDTVIVGDLTRIVTYPHKFTMAHEFYRPTQGCSTAMAWNGDFSMIYDRFKADPTAAKDYRTFSKIGDQAFIEDVLACAEHPIQFFRDVCGEHSVASYKVDKCKDGPPKGAAVVAFHGRPKPDEIHSGWVRKAWAA